MFCPLCGKKLDDDAAFCPYCGTKAPKPAPEDIPKPRNENDEDDFFSVPPPALRDARPNPSPQPSTPAKINTLALVGFILSFFSALAGLICSIIGLKQCNARGDGGRGFAIAGIVISAVSFVLSIILLNTLFSYPTYL